jgi:DNA polymerase III sliding clamp (beta) subunit (PCNA family)
MNILQSLKFVQGAVAKKDFVPALTHFRIKNNTVKAFNGNMAICGPIAVNLDISPNAEKLTKVIAACNDTVTLHMNDKGKLVVCSGDFKAFINCDNVDNFPNIVPTGERITLKEPLIPALTYLEPYIAEDASRPWSCGILFDQESAFATNNIVLVQHWLGFKFPMRVNIPRAAVEAILGIGENPIALQFGENRLSFHFTEGRWLSTQLLEATWPDVATLLNTPSEEKQKPFPKGFWDALERLLPFCDDLGRCYLKPDCMASRDNADLVGENIEINLGIEGIFNARHLSNLKTIADTIAFSAYPAPVPFYGKRSRGIIVGIRK